jgi:hypothetical protein
LIFPTRRPRINLARASPQPRIFAQENSFFRVEVWKLLELFLLIAQP